MTEQTETTTSQDASLDAIAFAGATLAPFFLNDPRTGDAADAFAALAELDALTDVIIVDTGAGISDSVLEFLVASGEVLLVTTPEPTSITDSYSLLKALYRHPRYEEAYTKVKMVANRVENVKEGQVLAIVEAMKLMNEIESDFTGTVTEILVENGQAVEYGQPLFVIS